MKLLLDTHVWLWHVRGDRRLPDKYRRLIEQTRSDLWLSPVSLWECLLLAECGKISIGRNAAEWIGQTLEKFPLREARLTNAVALESRRYPDLHEDPADRLLVATALIYELKLLTLDSRLLERRGLPVFRG